MTSEDPDLFDAFLAGVAACLVAVLVVAIVVGVLT